MTTKKPIYVQPTAQKWPLIALTETIIEQIGCAMYTKTMGARHHLTTPCTDMQLATAAHCQMCCQSPTGDCRPAHTAKCIPQHN